MEETLLFNAKTIRVGVEVLIGFLIASATACAMSFAVGAPLQPGAGVALGLAGFLAFCLLFRAAAGWLERKAAGRPVGMARIAAASAVLVAVSHASKALAGPSLHVREVSAPIWAGALFFLFGILFCAFVYRWFCSRQKSGPMIAAALVLLSSSFASQMLDRLIYGGPAGLMSAGNFAAEDLAGVYAIIGIFALSQAFMVFFASGAKSSDRITPA